MANTTNYAETLAAEIINALKNGTAPWTTPWETGETQLAPHNALTGNAYQGINNLHLSMSHGGYVDQRWCTYKQAQQMGAHVKKGEHGSMISHYNKKEEALC